MREKKLLELLRMEPAYFNSNKNEEVIKNKLVISDSVQHSTVFFYCVGGGGFMPYTKILKEVHTQKLKVFTIKITKSNQTGDSIGGIF